MQSIDSQKISTINNIKKVLSKYYINSKGEFHISRTLSLIREAAKKEKREIPERTILHSGRIIHIFYCSLLMLYPPHPKDVG